MQSHSDRTEMKDDLLKFIWLSVFILILEIAGGIYSKSLSLLSDSGHVLVDVSALLIAYFSFMLSKKAANSKFSYGYYRAEIFAAMLNGILLVLICVFIGYHAYARFFNPVPIEAGAMFVISLIGLLANAYVALKMRSHGHENLSMQGAYLHVLVDLLSSVGVVMSSIIILMTNFYMVDTIASMVIVLIVLFSAWKLIRQTIDIFMEAVPAHIIMDDLLKSMRGIRGVCDVHHVHVWSIASDSYAISAHLMIKPNTAKQINKIISNMSSMLKKKYKISHATLQCECNSCAVVEP